MRELGRKFACLHIVTRFINESLFGKLLSQIPKTQNILPFCPTFSCSKSIIIIIIIDKHSKKNKTKENKKSKEKTTRGSGRKEQFGNWKQQDLDCGRSRKRT